jgi:hypothetical protein
MIAPFEKGQGVNVLTPQQRNTIVTLLQNRVTQHEINRKTGIDRKTIRKVAKELIGAEASVPNSPMATGSPCLPDQNPPPWPPAPAETRSSELPAHARSACEPHRVWIEAQVGLGRNATAIYQELVDHHDFKSRYNSVKRFCRDLRQREPEQFDRLEFLPGEEAQVDYGEGAPTLHPTSGRYCKPRLFIMTLRY